MRAQTSYSAYPSVDHFTKNFGDLGEIFMVTIGHDGSGIFDGRLSGWKVDKVRIFW